MSEPLLNLDTLIVRPSIQIDGERFELFSADELSVTSSHRFSVWGRRIEQLEQSDSDDEATLSELDALYAQVARAAIVAVPDDVFIKLSGTNQIAIVDVFTGLLLRNRLGVAGAMATAMETMTPGLWTGERLSPDFNASSAAIRAGGWKQRLARWCGLI